MTRKSIACAIGSVGLGLLPGFLIANWTSAHTPAVREATRTAAAAPPAAQQGKPAVQVYKNIQVFKELSDTQLIAAMQFMAASLGVSCDHCHVNDNTNNWPMEKDDKEQKRTARRMILMVRSINRENFGGNLTVSCATCHRGQTQPLTIPPVIMPTLQRSSPATEAATANPKSASTPTVAQILDRYTEALGGKAAIERVRSRVMKGSLLMATGAVVPLEVYAQAPDKYLSIITTRRGPIYRGYNGKVGWTKGPNWQNEMEADELAQIKRLADFYKEIRLMELYTGLTGKGTEQIGAQTAYVIEATSRDNQRERLYFDVQTGLLIRRSLFTETVLGSFVDQTDFEDYRAVDGVKLPFIIKRAGPTFKQAQQYHEIKQNVSVDDATFNMPAAK